MIGQAGRRVLIALALLALPAGALVVTPCPAIGQALDFSAMEKDGTPIEILADQGIEWRQKEQVVIAHGNAKATRGNTSVKSDTLSAYYRETPDGQNEVYRIEATGNVLITSEESTLEGGKAVYDVDKDLMVVTGDDLRLITPEHTVTADKSMEFDNRKQVATARGNAVMVKGDQRVRADVLTAYIGENAQGKSEIRRVEAIGNVLITTPTEVARSDRADYDVAREIATLSGSVKLTRGKNQLNGAFAEVNMRTGVSRLLARPGEAGGQVRGLFVPQKDAPDSPAR